MGGVKLHAAGNLDEGSTEGRIGMDVRHKYGSSGLHDHKEKGGASIMAAVAGQLLQVLEASLSGSVGKEGNPFLNEGAALHLEEKGAF